MELKDYLKIMVMKDASDLYLTTGAPASAKIQGQLTPLEATPLPPGRVQEIAYQIMDEEQKTAFKERPECNMAISEPGVGRFRVNIFKQRNQVGMVIRAIKMDIPSWQSLGLPEILTKLVMQKRGLVLFVGGTGSGKSTSLAALIDYRNSNSAGHIITIEDPMEFSHEHKRSIVDQREVGLDTLSYGNALKNAMREAPDLILIGEIRDVETMRHAIVFAETGHLCLSTVHANNSNQTLDRVVNFFESAVRRQLLMDLSSNLKAIICQRLVMGVDGKRLPVVEVLLNTLYISDLIAKGEVEGIKEAMERSEMVGMCTFDQCLFRYYQQGRITEKEALANADSRNNLQVKINLTKGIADASHLQLHDADDEEEETRGNKGKGGRRR